MRGGPPLSLRTSIRENLTLLDRLVIGYLLVFSVCLIIAGRGDPGWFARLIVNLALVAAALAMIRWWSGRTRGVSGFLRQLYPGLLYPFFYRQMQVAVHWLIPRFLDHQVVSVERAMFGVDPNIWIQPVQTPLLNEWMMAGYFAYFFLIPIVILPLHFRHRHDEAHRLLTATTIAFLISYVGFVLYPVEGPRFFLADRLNTPLSGWLFVPLVNWIITGGAIHGGCMPSSHTAVALVVLIWARRTQPRLAAWLAPFVFTLFAATVWGRFHYLSDMVIGWMVGLAAVYLADRLADRRLVSSRDKIRSSEALAESVVQTAGYTKGSI
jgi:membrane-associated phospholipid phosphatase